MSVNYSSKHPASRHGNLSAFPVSLASLLEQIGNSARRESFSPVTEQPFLLINLNSKTNQPEHYRTLAQLLHTLACPVIGFYPDRTLTETDRDRIAMIDALDLVVTTSQDLQAITANISRCPVSAMTLVQLTRRHAHQHARTAIDDGLLAESLAYATLQGGSEFRHFLDQKKPASVTQQPHSNEPAVLFSKTVISDITSAETETKEARYQLTITLNRPQQRNAYNTEMRDALVDALHLLDDDSTIEQARITGAGSCFCIGGDLAEFGLCQDSAVAHAIRSTRNAGKLISLNADRIHCHAHRACIGSGIELPAFASTFTATQNTFFQLPEITMGLIPGAGGTVSITRRIGRQRMNWLALSAKRINARTALEWGLIDAITEEDRP